MAESLLLTGKRGEGKSLGAVKKIEEYIRAGRSVATNLNIRIEELAPSWSRVVCWRLPDHPAVADLEALPLGNPDPVKEENNGLLVLDECATFLASREWRGQDRQDVIKWLLQSRKFGWDLLLIAQHPRLVDAQIRDSLCELHGQARRLDKIAIPFFSAFAKHYFGIKLRLPKLHIVTFRYGFGPGAPVAEKMIFRGADIYRAYDTLQKIDPLIGQAGLSSYLSAWHLRGRYMSWWRMHRGMMFVGLVFGLVLGGPVGYLWGGSKGESVHVETAIEKEKLSGVVTADDGRYRVVFPDGRVGVSMQAVANKRGTFYEVDGRWYEVQK